MYQLASLLAMVGVVGWFALNLKSDFPNISSDGTESFADSNHLVGSFAIDGGRPEPIRQQLRLASYMASRPETGGQDDFENSVLPFLNSYCLDCHSGDGAEGGLDLDRFSDIQSMRADLETWSHVLKRLEQGDMPPQDYDQPDRKARIRMQNRILDEIKKIEKSDLNLGTLRRLNRVEYENTIRELLRLSRHCFNNSARITRTDDYFQPASGKMPRYVLAVSHFYNAHRRHSDLPGVSSLPVDPPVEHGFSNDQDALSLSPLLMENYFEVSTAILNSQEFPQICGIWDSMFVAVQPGNSTALQTQGREQITQFLPRAFRRPVANEELERYVQLFERELADSGSYERSMKSTVAAILVSPKFLYRQEFVSPQRSDESNQDNALDENYSLASRLSYFLWGSMPDDALFQAAREQRLTQPSGLRAEVKRMMKDRRVKSLSTDFGMQWLKVQKAASSLPDKTRYPSYYGKELPPPAVAMMIEQMLFFEAIMIENRSILEFISSDFGYVNRQLMNLYQLNPKTSLGYTPPLEDFEDFFRVRWPNTHRGGVITAGATLISASTTTRTSPVFRGAWILDVIFNAPPPAPPADVPPLEPADGDPNVSLNVREKLEQHRANPACASCHARLDPPGFALERFDAIGRWRQTYETGDPIDCTGELDGVPFNGAARFKSVILKDKSKFVKAFVEHTMKYALGRQLHYSDQPEIRRIAQVVIERNCRFSSVIEEVVLSEPFRRFHDPATKRNEQ